MHLKSLRLRNFRRLSDVRIDFDPATTIFVGANNSGKTSAVDALQLFLTRGAARFRVHDFAALVWPSFEVAEGDASTWDPPRIEMDLWFAVDDLNLHRVINFIPDLTWEGAEVGLRLAYEPRNPVELLAEYRMAQQKVEVSNGDSVAGGEERSWPASMVQYLDRRLRDEYEINLYCLDRKYFDNHLNQASGWKPRKMAGGPSLVDELMRVDFVGAQRMLADPVSGHRVDALSRRISQFYQRNLEQAKSDTSALIALVDAQERMNDHFDVVFRDVIDQISVLGYPGVIDPEIVIRASLDGQRILRSDAGIYYSLGRGSDADSLETIELPDSHNGLGLKNLIFMAVEILDFHESWLKRSDSNIRPPIHLIVIEEPEAHLHAQVQQVFVRKVRELVTQDEEALRTQLVITTHSSHILREQDFKPIRYFCRETPASVGQFSSVRDLSHFRSQPIEDNERFLLQYLKLAHCDLFFADAAILVEGNVERLLLPSIIEKGPDTLRSAHLSILEVGGAFAHVFQGLVEFLDLPVLVITDLDSVAIPAVGGRPIACMATTKDAITSNQTLVKWLPGESQVSRLTELGDDQKVRKSSSGTGRGRVRVAYQALQEVSWNGTAGKLVARTFEEDFALKNLQWCMANGNESLGLAPPGSHDMSLSDLHEHIYNAVRQLPKTEFAMEVLSRDSSGWQTPNYIAEGLVWLSQELDVARQFA